MRSLVSLLFSLLVVALLNSQSSALSTKDSRRAFLNKAAGASGAVSMGFLLQLQDHSNCGCDQCMEGVGHDGCNCNSCSQFNMAKSHGEDCGCGTCSPDHTVGCACVSCQRGVRLGLRPPSANAYEARIVGGPDRSPTTAAFNIQSYETMTRLEKAGFPVDSKADEAARLANALSSYTYSPSATSTKGQKKDNSKKQK